MAFAQEVLNRGGKTSLPIVIANSYVRISMEENDWVIGYLIVI